MTCLVTVEAYYSRFNGNPRWYFTPGMRGVVASIAPKVIIKRCGPQHDGRDEFLVVDYDDVDGTPRRVSLNFCNAVILERIDENKAQGG